MWAARNGQTEMATLLTNNRADINIKDNEDMPALMLAAHKGHTETVQLLIQNGANINIQDENGWTAFYFTKIFIANFFIILHILSSNYEVKICTSRFL